MECCDLPKTRGPNTSGLMVCPAHCSKCGHLRRYENYLDFCSICDREGGPCARAGIVHNIQFDQKIGMVMMEDKSDDVEVISPIVEFISPFTGKIVLSTDLYGKVKHGVPVKKGDTCRILTNNYLLVGIINLGPTTNNPKKKLKNIADDVTPDHPPLTEEELITIENNWPEILRTPQGSEIVLRLIKELRITRKVLINIRKSLGRHG